MIRRTDPVIYSSNIVQILILACVPAITWVMSSSLRETRTMTISGMVV